MKQKVFVELENVKDLNSICEFMKEHGIDFELKYEVVIHEKGNNHRITDFEELKDYVAWIIWEKEFKNPQEKHDVSKHD